jgi:hypothetical protein
MALKAMVKSLDGIDAALKALYRKEGEGDKAVFLLDVEPVEGFALEHVTGLKTTVQKLREADAEKDQRLAAFKDLDATKARDALKKIEDMKNWTPEDKVREQIELRTKEVAAAKDAELGKLTQQHQQLLRGYEAVTVERALTVAAQKAKFVAPEIAARLFRENVKLDDKLQPVVVGQDGKAKQVVNNDGTVRNQTIEEYVAEQARDQQYAPLLAGSGGTGTQGGRQGASGNQNSNGSGKSEVPLHLQRQQIDNDLATELLKSRS